MTTPAEVIQQALVPGTRSVLVLGVFEKRVTVYAQQIRALNLVDAMLDEGLVPEKGKVAVIGGGVAGVTAAVALSKAAPNLKALHLFESRPNVLQLQRSSTRYLHPHFYDWPSPGWDTPDAGLPIMNWSAGPAGTVAATLMDEFEKACRTSILTPFDSTRVTELQPSTTSTVRVIVEGGSAIGRIYDAVILAIGFGLERSIANETPSYWTPPEMCAPIHAPIENPLIFISGNGDGGLVDFQIAALDGLSHEEIATLIMELNLGTAEAELRTIEQEAWQPGATIDLLEAYRTRVKPKVPDAVWPIIIDKLRPGTRLIYHTNEPVLLRRTTALHNRFATFLILEADHDTGRDAIEVITGAEFGGGAAPIEGPIQIEGQAPFEPFKRRLRLGPDLATNLLPFASVLAAYPPAQDATTPIAQPRSPVLTESARLRFEALAAPEAPAAAAAPAPLILAAPVTAPSAIQTVVITADEAGLTWSGTIRPETAGQVWAAGQKLEVIADVNASNAAALAPAIARLGAHAAEFELKARDTSGWGAAMTALCSAEAMPGPDVAVRCAITDWTVPAEQPETVQGSAVALASTVHTELDRQLLGALNDSMYQILGPPADATGWPIEPILRALLWDRWQQWLTILNGDSNATRRFLLLLATEHDRSKADDRLLIRLGPKIIRPILTRPAIFGLAFATCSAHQVQPMAAPPGNIAANGISAHTCGIEWMEGRDLASSAVARHGWTAAVILLAQLKVAFRFLDEELRFDQDPDDPARIGFASASERPIIIGADDQFLDALASGEDGVRSYFEGIFAVRAEAARRALEQEAGRA